MSATNSFSQTVDIYFDEVVAGFEATNTTAKNVSTYKPNAGKIAESGQAFYRPQPFLTEVVDGRDVSSAYNDLTELTVPSVLTDAHLRNVPVSFTGVDLNNPHIMQRAVKAATVMLNNKVDTVVANEIASKGTLVYTNSGAISTYEELAVPDAMMLEQQATKGQRCMLLNPRMSVQVSGNLAGRDNLNGVPLDAYRRASLQPIAGFDTFRTDYGKSITGSSAASYAIDGGAQDYTPLSKDGNDLPVDNRVQTITVKTGTGAAVGDAFTVANVYATGHINKQSTGELKTFRILAVNSSTSWDISPPFIPADGSDQAQKDYGNIDTVPADSAAITVLNTVTKPCSVFYEKDCVEIIHADYNLDPFRESGKQVRVKTTDSGITIAMLSDSNVDTLVAKYRMFIWMNVNVLQPEAAGIMLPFQT